MIKVGIRATITSNAIRKIQNAADDDPEDLQAILAIFGEQPTASTLMLK